MSARTGSTEHAPATAAEGAAAAEAPAAGTGRAGRQHAPARRPGGGPMGHMGMGMPTAKPLDFKGSLRRLLGELRPERGRLTLVVLLTLGSVAGTVFGPKVLGWATDVVFRGFLGIQLGRQAPAGATTDQIVEGLRAQGQTELADVISATDGVVPGVGIDFDDLRRVLMIALALYLGAWLLGYLQGLVTTGIVQRTVFRLRERVQAKLGRVPLSYIDSHPRGELLSRVTNDIDNIAQTMQQTLSQLISSVLTILGVLAMMFWISPLLAVISLVVIPVSGVVTAMIAKRSQPQFTAQWQRTGTLNAHVEEMYTGHALVKVFGRQKAASDTFHTENEALYEATFKAHFISGLIHPAMMFIGILNYVVIAVVGALRVASGSMTIGDVQAFIQYSRQFTQPIMQVASMMNLLQSGLASAERVFELLDAEEQSPEPAAGPRPDVVRGRVAFENVAFSYSPDAPLIEDLSLVAEPGQTVAIVGPTGAGKTTLVNLLMRFYELNGGRITLDGVDVAQMDREELRQNIGMVLQDTWLFGGTIRDNVAYGKLGATEDEVVEAARITHVDRFVRTLPDGYDTVIDEEASNVSAGEKQLLTIARAFLADPPILVLDEATSSVDTRTEVLVQHAMAALRQGRTSFVIAHRLSTIRDADVILVMENGAIVEQGSHAELIEAGGAYARLYASQFAAAAAEVD
ncbi:ABC transporter ATP-binding protein [Actinotalea fermentans]|uniref:Fatty acid ABC transporter ATP-binding/permease protein n=1 Tax=Actinotalea fermentans TaxID=43671 RepID=A0A511YVD3_9CELL|nr:multidrug ABC transporter ATP-binding protein [Actinotalea fermentans ATCC 43279 = JCM 9966 = DSM 3133]GEN79139.1 multidrug ABC transporter ATP-binding protein [Actinotalea fermentans]